MTTVTDVRMGRAVWAGLVLCALARMGVAQGAASPVPSPAGTPAAEAEAAATSAAASVAADHGPVVDQVVAVVNGDLVLESDVDEERRFQAFQPFRDAAVPYTRDRAVERLVDRTLILQQEKIQPQVAIPDTEVAVQLAGLRKEIPACKQYACETDAGWQRFLAAQGFSQAELNDRWRERMEVLRFIEQRFKMGIRISPAEIKSYYEKTLLPEYAKRGAPAPKLQAISERIQEILLQQQVGALLQDWLQSLKAQGSVRLAHAGEVQP